jgi:predicted porin
MKKSFIALAALGAIAGTAHAQTAVTIYGIVDAGVVHEDKGDAAVPANPAKPGGTKWSLSSGAQSGSRIGFKGSEDLGGGTSAIFTLENGFNSDDGTLGQSDATHNRLFGRQAWVGLSGAFGAVKLGRQNTPMRNVLSTVNPFDIGDLAGNLDKTFDDDGGGFRSDNTINYSTPNTLGGFFLESAYSFGEVANDNSASRQLGLGTGYANGPIYAALAYHDIKNDAATGGSHNTTFIGGTYDFQVAKLHLGYAKNKADTTALGNTVDSKDALIGTTVPFSNNLIEASYVRHKDDLKANADFKRLALGYNYSFSKRTNLYTAYARTNNDAASAKFVDKAGQNYSVFTLGVRHKF